MGTPTNSTADDVAALTKRVAQLERISRWRLCQDMVLFVMIMVLWWKTFSWW